MRIKTAGEILSMTDGQYFSHKICFLMGKWSFLEPARSTINVNLIELLKYSAVLLFPNFTDSAKLPWNSCIEIKIAFLVLQYLLRNEKMWFLVL